MSPYLPLDPFSSHERPRSSKKGAATSVQTFTFFQVLDSLPSGRDPPKRGAATCHQCSFHFGFNLLFSLAQGKCMASLQEDPAENSLCLASFYRATTVQGLELDLRFCDGKLNCYYCCTASPYLPLDPLLRPERPRSSKKGRRNLTSAPTRHLVLLSAFATHRGCTTVSSLGSCPLCLSAC